MEESVMGSTDLQMDKVSSHGVGDLGDGSAALGLA